MLKKIFYLLLIIVSLFLYGCARENPNTPAAVTTKGVFVLCEGSFSQPGDLSFINTNNDSVYNNIYSNSNNGANLAPFPDDFFLLAPYIFIVAQGQWGGPGKMYKLDYNTYKLLDTSANFGVNPYEFGYAEGIFFVTNTAGSTVTEMTQSFHIVNEFQVGPKPTEIVFGFHSLYVAKQNYDQTENSVAVIDVLSHNVTKAFFPAPPVSVAFTTYGIFVADYSNKKLYMLDTSITNRIIDSVALNVPSNAIGKIVAGDQGILYLVGVADTAFQSNIGNTVYKYSIDNRALDPGFSTIQMSTLHDVYGIAYDKENKLIYIADSQGGAINGLVSIYSATGSFIKTYAIVGKHPSKFAFKYDNH